MKSILCFGDSNTWGYIPGTGERYASSVRWPGIAQLVLGSHYKIIEEGLNGRTTSWDDPSKNNRNGKLFLPRVLEAHAPLDLVVIALGTNDLKACFDASPAEIAKEGASLIDLTQMSVPTPQVLLVSPAYVKERANHLAFKGGELKSKQLAEHYYSVAESLNCHFIDAALIVETSEIDGVHWNSEGHQEFGLQIAKKIKEIFE